MHAVILAAGEGTRMRPLTRYMPKVMLPVGNRPIMEYVVEALRKNGIFDIIMVVGYMADKVKQHFGDGRDFGVNIEYRTQKKLLGTAHALYQARDVNDDFILVFGDNLVGEDCINHIKNTEKNTILASTPRRSYIYGAVEVKNGVKIRERRVHDGMIFTGIGHFDSGIFSHVEALMDENIYDLPEVLNRFENLNYIFPQCEWEDAIYPWDLLSMNAHVLSKNGRSVAGKVESAQIIGNVEIGEGSVIGGHSYIKGNVKIGRNVVIGAGSVIIGDTSIGDGVQIGSLSYVENSIIMEGSVIGELSRIKDSVIGRDCTIHPRFLSLSGNRNLVSSEFVVGVEGGVVVGDNTVIGAGVVTKPCVRIGSNAIIAPLKVIGDDVDDDVRVM